MFPTWFPHPNHAAASWAVHFRAICPQPVAAPSLDFAAWLLHSLGLQVRKTTIIS